MVGLGWVGINPKPKQPDLSPSRGGKIRIKVKPNQAWRSAS